MFHTQRLNEFSFSHVLPIFLSYVIVQCRYVDHYTKQTIRSYIYTSTDIIVFVVLFVNVYLTNIVYLFTLEARGHFTILHVIDARI